MRNVIILGANGYIGSNLTKRLAEDGINVLALVLKGTEYGFLTGLDRVICKEFTFDAIFDIRITGFDTLYNMAWAGVCTNYKNEALTQAKNILYGLKAMEFAEINSIKKVIFPGSASEVSCGNGVITGHEMPAPSDMYSASKAATRFVCQTYARQHGIELIWTLITSVYGPGRNDNNLISYTIKTLLKGEKPSFTGLEQEWDYIYIDDLIDAFIALGKKGKGEKVYPVGSGTHRKMSEYIGIIRDKINSNLLLGIGDLPYKNPNQIDNQVLDVSELKKDTGFIPRYEFEEGISYVLDYYRNLNLEK